ncbi:MAG: restriction endonuclease subunit S [Lentisphaerae bacterium]|nr:restriction endonuclease subunit S [Lentisphaerota bacterium]
MSKWQQVKLGDIASNIQTGPFGSQLHQSDYSEIGTPVVMPKDLVEGKISEQSIARIEASHVERLTKHKIQSGDILYSRRGDVGRCAYAGKEESGWLCGTGCLRVTIDESQANPKFIFYQLQTSQSVGWVEKHAVGSTMLNLNTSILSNVPVSLPPLEVQRKIADVLSAYDDLIENNRKQIKLLEEAAQRLYKEWFIDLRFQGHETIKIINGIPEGWEKVQLCELIAFNPKITATNDTIKTFIPMEALSTSSMVISTAAVSETSKNAGSKFEIGDTLLARITPCLENGKTAFVSDIDKGVYGVGSTEFIVLRSKKLNPYIVYLLARTEEFRNYAINSMTGSDGRQRVKVDKLEMYSTLLPSRKIIDSFEQIVAPYFEKVKVLSKAVNSCQEARDYLLPKLMTGELEVK